MHAQVCASERRSVRLGHAELGKHGVLAKNTNNSRAAPFERRCPSAITVK